MLHAVHCMLYVLLCCYCRNLKGEGTKLGGVLVVSRSRGVVYQYQEMTGDLLPVDQIEQAVRDHL